jgi:hypothetical protein
VKEAVRRGARLLLGGSGSREELFPPTLLADVPNDARVMQEESFGPLVPVASVADDEEALARMNDSRYGLTASVWTTDCERAERFARDLHVGTVFQNRCDYLDPRFHRRAIGHRLHSFEIRILPSDPAEGIHFELQREKITDALLPISSGFHLLILANHLSENPRLSGTKKV